MKSDRLNYMRKMNYATEFKLLIATAFMIACAASATPIDASEQDLKTILTKLFASTGSRLEPEETLDLLKRLKNDYQKELDDDEQQTVVGLLKLSEPDESECRVHTFESIDGLQEDNADYKDTIVPYIEHFKLQQLEVCKPSMVEKLKNFVNSLSRNYADAMENLMNPLGREDEPYDGLESGLVELVKRSGVPIRRKAMKDKEEFLIVFGQVVDNFCGKLEESVIAEQRRIYDIVFYDEDVMVAVNKFIKNMKSTNTMLPLLWISYARICHDIRSHLFFYSEEVLSRLRKEETLRAKTKKFLRKLNIRY